MKMRKLNFKILIIFIYFFKINYSVAGDFCAYKNESQLLFDKNFLDRLHFFVGNRKAVLSGESQSIYELAVKNLEGPPDILEGLSPKFAFSSACRIHDCGDKAAVAIACPNSISAVGVFHEGSDPKIQSNERTLTIFYKKYDNIWMAAFQKWSANVEKNENTVVKFEMVNISKQ